MSQKEECAEYINDDRTIEYSKFKNDFKSINSSLFDLIDNAIAKSTKVGGNCTKSFVGFPRLQAHMVLVHQRVHLGHADHLKMFEKAPACAVCKSPKLLGLCNCDNKRAREVNAKPRSKRPKNSEVIPNLLSAETELVNLQDMIQSHSQQFANPNDGTKGNKESNGSKKEINNNLQSSGAVIDAVIDAVIGASDPFHQIWNKKTVLMLQRTNQLIFASSVRMFMHGINNVRMASIKVPSL